MSGIAEANCRRCNAVGEILVYIMDGEALLSSSNDRDCMNVLNLRGNGGYW